MQILIEKGGAESIRDAFGLICELAEFEKAPQEVSNTPELMLTQWQESAFEFFIAKTESNVVGLALYFYSYSTWKGRSLYMDDLYVKPEFRKFGIGKKLLDAVIKEGLNYKASKVHWQVLDWNINAIQFYEKYGVQLDGEWINCKLEGDALQHFPFD